MSTSNDDVQMIVWLAGAGGCSLDSSPGKNWVEKSGGLPQYICKIARAVMKTGKSKSSAIAIAVSRTKKWAAGGDNVDEDTRTKASAAVAEWEALKGKNKANKLVKASREDGSQFLMFSNIGSFNTDMVRRAWEAKTSAARRAAREAAQAQGLDPYSAEASPVPYSWVRELWTDYIIVDRDSESSAETGLFKVPYSVSGMDVNFGEPVEVKQAYVEVDEDLTAEEKEMLSDVLTFSQPAPGSAAERMAALGKKLLDSNGLVR